MKMVYVVLRETQDDPSEVLWVSEDAPTDDELKAIPIGPFQGIEVKTANFRESKNEIPHDKKRR